MPRLEAIQTAFKESLKEQFLIIKQEQSKPNRTKEIAKTQQCDVESIEQRPEIVDELENLQDLISDGAIKKIPIKKKVSFQNNITFISQNSLTPATSQRSVSGNVLYDSRRKRLDRFKKRRTNSSENVALEPVGGVAVTGVGSLESGPTSAPPIFNDR